MFCPRCARIFAETIPLKKTAEKTIDFSATGQRQTCRLCQFLIHRMAPNGLASTGMKAAYWFEGLPMHVYRLNFELLCDDNNPSVRLIILPRRFQGKPSMRVDSTELG